MAWVILRRWDDLHARLPRLSHGIPWPLAQRQCTRYTSKTWRVAAMCPLEWRIPMGTTALPLQPVAPSCVLDPSQPSTYYSTEWWGIFTANVAGVWSFQAPEEFAGPNIPAGYDLRLWLDGKEWQMHREISGLGAAWQMPLAVGQHKFRMILSDARCFDKAGQNVAGAVTGLWRDFPQPWTLFNGSASAIKVFSPGATEPAALNSDWFSNDGCSRALKTDDVQSGPSVGSAMVMEPTATAFPSTVKVYSSGTAPELWSATKLAEVLSLPLHKLPPPPPMNQIPAAAAAEQARAGSAIYVGYHAAILAGVPAVALSAEALPGDDSSFIQADIGGIGGDVVIASSAASPRGTLNGIYSYMRGLGFRFLTHNATVVPTKPWVLPNGWDTPQIFTPPLQQRDMDTSTAADLGRRVFIGDHTKNNFSIYWPASNYSAAVGLNGFFAFPPVGGRQAQANWGWGGTPNGGRAGYVATAYDLLCESLVADTSDCAGKGTNDPHPHNSPCLATWRQHPEWFVCKPVTCDLAVCPSVYPCTLAEVNRTYNSQPCWSNTSLQNTMARNILRVLRQNPSATSVSVTGMDGAPCECPPDGVANREENTTGGANFRAIQSIAAIVNKEFPRVKLQTLAYQGSLSPPKSLRFGENVVVQLASGFDKFVPLSDPKNAHMVELVRGWLKVVPTLYIWDYTCNFENTIIPFGNYFAQAHHIKELVALGVKGYYGEGCPHPGVDMIDMKTYVAARTAFDPALDTATLVTAFINHFYSAAAAPHVRTYMEIMAKSYSSSNSSLDIYGKPLTGDPSRHMGITNAIFGNRTLLSAAAALSRAKDAAMPGKIYQLRLSQAMLNVAWVILRRWDDLHAFAASHGIPWPLAHSKAAVFADFSTGLTFAFDVDEPKFSGSPYFYEHVPVSPGSTRYTSKTCNLICFAQQLGLPPNATVRK